MIGGGWRELEVDLKSLEKGNCCVLKFNNTCLLN